MVIIETDDTVVNSIHDVVADAKKKKRGGKQWLIFIKEHRVGSSNI